jgi:hypothetical protein
MKAMMAVLRPAVADEEAARRAYAAVHTYTVGFAALEASRAGWSASGASTDSLASELASYTTPSQFAEGLRYLLEGIEHHSHLGTGAGGDTRTISEVPGRGPCP